MAPERPLTDGEAEALTEACFRLPLALRAAGAYLKGRPDVAVAEYVSDLGDERKRLKLLKYDPAGLDVGAALGLSAKQLQRENADLAARWRMLAAFPAGLNAPAAGAVGGPATSAWKPVACSRSPAASPRRPTAVSRSSVAS